MKSSPEQLAAELYDVTVPGWDGEIDFYCHYADQARERGQSVLEVACGTGRVTLRLAQEGMKIIGSDLDEEMLKVARRKSASLPNVGWVRGDMRSLELGETFGLIIVPGHSFQFMCTPEDQVRALQTFKRHLSPGGFVILHLDHQSVDWLGSLFSDQGGKFEAGKSVIHPRTGHTIRKANAWRYERSTQTATVVTKWEEIGGDGSIMQAWEREPMSLHCAFPFEMEHLLARTGFEERTAFGDFFGNPLNENSPEMIWVARAP